MSAPKDIKDYVVEWGEMVLELEAGREWICVCPDLRSARAMRLRYYGFRAAIKRYDPLGDWAKVLQGKSARIVGAALVVGPDPIDALLRQIKGEKAKVVIPSTEEQAQEQLGPSTEDVLEGLYGKGEKHE